MIIKDDEINEMNSLLKIYLFRKLNISSYVFFNDLIKNDKNMNSYDSIRT